jgi:hypothetical protein
MAIGISFELIWFKSGCSAVCVVSAVELELDSTFVEPSSSSSSVQPLSSRARFNPCRAELEQPTQARLELEPGPIINKPSLDSLGSPKLGSFTALLAST